MSKQGSLTVRHLVIAVLVVIVVNAQLTWWIIFVIGQSRTVLDLERERLVERCQREAGVIGTAVERAEQAATALGTLTGPAPPRRPDRDGGSGRDVRPAPPAPFVRWLTAAELSGEPGWHGGAHHAMWFEVECPSDAGVCGLAVDPRWAEGLLDVGPGVALTPADEVAQEVRPAVPLVAPFDGLALRPPAEAWDEVLSTYRRRIVMMASEGAFFAVLLVVLIGLLWRILHRETELERRYRNFLSAITHELKSPLAAIRLSLQTIAAGRADEATARRFVGNALTDTDRLERLISKVLQATRYDSGGDVMRKRRVDLSELVARVLVDFEPRAAAGKAALSSDLEPGVHGSSVDPEAFAIAVSNLLENALTYGGRPPEIRVRLQARGGRAVLDVTDNGSGIGDDDLPHVFDRFYRVGDEMTRTGQGTGLGLYLVQRIVTAHRGTVAVAATGNDGTTFRVTLPQVEVEEARE